MTMRRTTRNAGWTIGGLALLALAIAGGVWLYPEFRRYIHVRAM